MAEEKSFQIGLCLAGAVSAGAYTAGVMDYLLEALSTWENQKGNKDVPSHKVTIPIMGGASAGGMTALLTATTINNFLKPVEIPLLSDLLKEHPENKLYHSWVDLIDKDMFPIMLETSDISSGNVTSLLNSDFIDQVAKKMIQSDTVNWLPPHPAFKFPVKIFTTLSNLEGFHYNIGLSTGRDQQKYNMSIHNDYACFELFHDDIITSKTKGWIPLNFKTKTNVDIAIEAAMATGAFPIGLKSREVNRHSSYLKDNPWLEGIFKNTPLISGNIKTLNVDGGMINNEPFDKVRDLLDRDMISERNLENGTDEEKQKIKDLNCNFETFENTVLMIDPFPSTADEIFKFDKDISNIIKKTLSAMTSQMRSKPLDYKKAMTATDPGQFMISPSREIRDKNGKVTEELFGEKAIACGALGGFGGFISKEFRIHDFYLGRQNCEIFLRDYFTISPEAKLKNPIFRDGYSEVSGSKHISTKTGGYQIIPIFNSNVSAFPMPTFSQGSSWPVITQSQLNKFEKPIRKRVEKILMNLAELNKLNSALLWVGAKIVLNRMLADKAISAIKSSMIQWKLLGK